MKWQKSLAQNIKQLANCKKQKLHMQNQTYFETDVGSGCNISKPTENPQSINKPLW